MKKSIETMVWPQPDYTNIIHAAVRETFHQSPFVTFTYDQLKDQLVKRLPWLSLDTHQKQLLLNKIVNTAIKKYIQIGLVKQVESNLSVSKQWIWAQFVDRTSYKNRTTSSEVASSEEAIAACLNRAISKKTLAKLNEASRAVSA